MPERVKVRLRVGSREIELEGTREEVDGLLEKWWTTSSTDSTDSHEEPDDQRSAKSVPVTRRKRLTRAASSDNARKPPFDPQPVVNAMREAKHHDVWETKVLHAKSAINKIKLVCWFSKEHRTTGEIKAILEGLGVKMSLPNVSNSLKSSLSDFLQDGARSKGAVVRYKLTGKAEKDFEAWLNKHE